MSKDSSILIIIWLLIQLLIDVNCQAKFKSTTPRYLHTATFINKKLYILGGRNDEMASIAGKKFFYLDVTASFDTNEVLWNDLTGNNNVPSHDSATSVTGGINNNSLILLGGIPQNDKESMDLVYKFETKTNSWTLPRISENKVDNIIISISSLTGIINNGQIYLFGGKVNNEDFNDLLVLDIINLSWGKASIVNAPTPRFYYGATLLPDQCIIYLGGYHDGPLPLNEIYIYDTINNFWATTITRGANPSDRYGFSVVLGLDGRRIIIFGGYHLKSLDPQDSLYVLDLTNFRWYTPKISGKVPSSRIFHQANVIEHYMVISFGMDYNPNIDNDILLLDIGDEQEYIWTSSFEVNPTVPVTIGIIIGSVAGCVLLLLGGLFIYKRYTNKKEKNKVVLPTPEVVGNKDVNRRDINDLRHEILTVPTDNNDDGREITSNIDYQRSGSLRDVDLKNFKNEMLQIVRQEIQQNLKQDVAQNSEQASNANVLENFKNEMIQVVKQEMETLRQDAAHDSGQDLSDKLRRGNNANETTYITSIDPLTLYSTFTKRPHLNSFVHPFLDSAL
ncbi:6737_t:CDS:2 [Funneliformis caledonium]|uniref:6737_t:CDS:1 n=1 Tax=Funneliformis caledonium TaxID=1117310 RepID=A0A9N9AGJ5_9GLOM|nr:6737_t:CDS:2 [Funneliformis caledonium]